MGKVIKFETGTVVTSGIRSRLITDTLVALDFQYIVSQELIIDDEVDFIVEGEAIII